MDSVSVTKSIRVSPEMATLMDNLIAAGEFSTTSELILKALAEFLERYEPGTRARILRVRAPAQVEQRLEALVEAGEALSVEDAALLVLRLYAKERLRALAGEAEEIDGLKQKMQKRSVDLAIEKDRDHVVTK